MRADIAIKRKVSAGWVILGFKLSLKTIYEIDEVRRYVGILIHIEILTTSGILFRAVP